MRWPGTTATAVIRAIAPAAFLEQYSLALAHCAHVLKPDGKLAVLEPVKRKRMFGYTDFDGPVRPVADDPEFLNEAIAQYQTASYLFAHGLNREDNAR